MAIRLTEPHGRVTHPTLKYYIDRLFDDLKPKDDLVKAVAVLCLMTDYVAIRADQPDPDLPLAQQELILRSKNEARKLIGHIDIEMKHNLKKYGEQYKITVAPKSTTEFINWERDHVAFPDQVHWVTASFDLLKKCGPDGIKYHEQLERTLHPMLDVFNQYFTEGLLDLIATGATATLSTVWAAVSTIFGPIIRIFLKMIGQLSNLLYPMTKYMADLFERSRLERLPPILETIATPLAALGYGNLWILSSKISTGIYLAGRLLRTARFATSVGRGAALVEDLAKFAKSYQTGSFDLGGAPAEPATPPMPGTTPEPQPA